MPMADGTTSVHTNTWTEALPWEESTTTTNIAAGSYYDLLFTSREVEWDSKSAPAAMKPFPAYSYIKDSYSFLRNKKWLVD